MRNYFLLENVNYGREELFYLNLCREGVIGDLLHAEAAYIHELRFQMEEQERVEPKVYPLPPLGSGPKFNL